MSDSKNDLSNYSNDELTELLNELVYNAIYGLKELKLIVTEAVNRKPELRRKVFNMIQQIKSVCIQQLDVELQKLTDKCEKQQTP